MRIQRVSKIVGVAITSMSIALSGTLALASPTSQFSQVINAGTLSTDIRDASRVTVASPSVSMSTKTAGFDCYSGGTASTGTLGSNTQRLYVDNPDAADNGWTLTVAASSTTALWQNTGATQTFDFNDGGGSGCTDGGDADNRPGQMTIDASVGTLTADCLSCTTTNVTKGASAAFVQGSVDSVTLLTAAAGSDDVWRGYLTGASVSQTIPAEQMADTYTISLTLTVTAS